MNPRVLILPLLVLGVAGLFHLTQEGKKGRGELRQGTPGPSPAADSPAGPPRSGPARTPPVLAPPPVVGRVHMDSSEVSPDLLLPGTAALNPEVWTWTREGVPSLAAARKLAAIRWEPPRPPLTGEEGVADPDRIGPCPPRRIPQGRKDTPVVRRYIDPQSFEPTWIHADGSFTKLNVIRDKDTGRLYVARGTGVKLVR